MLPVTCRRVCDHVYVCLRYQFGLFLQVLYCIIELFRLCRIFFLSFIWLLFFFFFFILFPEIACNPISLSTSQHVTSINKDKLSYDFLENVTVSCKLGFKGQSMTTKCTDVNKWSGTTPICISKCSICNISHDWRLNVFNKWFVFARRHQCIIILISSVDQGRIYVRANDGPHLKGFLESYVIS